MVAGENDECVVQHAGGGKGLDQRFHGIVELDLTGDIGLGRVGIGQGLHFGTVLGGHGVAAEIVFQMAADGHVINMERRLGGVITHGFFHHLHIAFGPLGHDVETVAFGDVVVAHVGMAFVAVVIGVAVVMVSVAEVALGGELIPHAEGHVVFGAFGHTPHPGFGQEPGADGVFAVAGGNTPDGVVVIFKNEAFVGHFPERRRQVLIQRPGGKAFGADPDQVFAREHPGVLILGRRRDGTEIFVHILEVGVGLSCAQRGEIDIQRVVFVTDIGVVAFPFFFGFVGTGGFRVGHAENHVFEIQLKGGDSAEILHRK